MRVRQNDTIELVIDEAVRIFGESDGTFNAACFSKALCQIAGVTGPIDGRVVRAILCGRPGVELLSPGDAHYRKAHR